MAKGRVPLALDLPSARYRHQHIEPAPSGRSDVSLLFRFVVNPILIDPHALWTKNIMAIVCDFALLATEDRRGLGAVAAGNVSAQ